MTTASELADRLDTAIRDHDHATAIRRGDLTHPDRWPLRTTADVAAFRSRLESIAVTGEELLAGALAERDRMLAEAVVYGARSTSARLDTEVELTSISPASGTLALALTFLPRHSLTTHDDGDRMLTRIAAFAPFVEEWRERLVAAAADGLVPSRHQVTEQLAMIDRNLARGLTHVIGVQQPPSELDDAAADRWRDALHQLIDASFTPALVRLRDVLAEHTLPAARSDDEPGLVHLPGGSDTYRRLLWANTSVDTAPAEVHRIGLEQIARLEDEYRDVAGPLLGTTDIGEIYRRLRDDESLRYDSADAIVADATVALARAAAVAPDWFVRLPEADCTAHPIDQGALAFYSPPSPDGRRGGEFFFRTDDPGMWGTYQLEAVTYHESIPGHHLQLALARELDEVHPLLETYLVPAYCEGWGLYTERLADEMGLYTTDLDRIGMLAADSMRAGRLVVDTGLHALGWSRQQAIDYLAGHSPLSMPLVEGEIDRYIGRPGQACSYMLGRLAIDAARAAAERSLGAAFDLREFHDVVLTTGSVPLDTLQWVVESWAAERRGQVTPSG
jgi:uncharacterized protein (DUF885 family)